MNLTKLALIAYTSTNIYQDVDVLLKPISDDMQSMQLEDINLLTCFLVVDLNTSVVFAMAAPIGDAPTQKILLQNAIGSGLFPSHDENAEVYVFQRNEDALQPWREEIAIGTSPVDHFDNAMRVGAKFDARIQDVLTFFRRQRDKHLNYLGLQFGLKQITKDFSQFLRTQPYSDLAQHTTLATVHATHARMH